ncbi:alpha/beta fold hydrolase [Candidatus Uhrbacteria bacterium]|nr:alpha/beta fold hydrolase [Candidatus Uhrbacteria bacterium]
MATLLVLHGWGHHKGMWTSFASMMQPALPTVVLDLPGFGDEPLVDANWQIPDYARWVADEVAKRGLTDVIMLGHSFGGRIAASLAAQRPSWLCGLILYGAPCLYRPTARVALQNSVARVLGRLPIPASLRAMARNDEDRAAHDGGLGAVFRNTVRFDQTSTLPRIAVPTLLVWGAEDADVPLGIARAMLALIPGAALEVIDRAGHNAHLDQPVLFYGIITRYVEALTSAHPAA